MAEKKYIGKPGKQDDPCWKGYEMVGMKKKNGRKVPNCVPEAREIIEKAKAKLKKDPLTGAKIDKDRFILPEEQDLEEGWGVKAHSFSSFKDGVQDWADNHTHNGKVNMQTRVVDAGGKKWHQTTASHKGVIVGTFNHSGSGKSEEGHGRHAHWSDNVHEELEEGWVVKKGTEVVSTHKTKDEADVKAMKHPLYKVYAKEEVELEEAYGMWKVDFPKQHAGKAVAAGSVHVKAQNSAHAHKVAAKRVGVDHKMFKTKVTKSSILPEELEEAENKQYIEITHQSGNRRRVPVHPLNAKRALKRYQDDPSTKSARFVDESKDDLPWEEDPKNPSRKSGERKDEYGNKIKNVAKHLAKKAMKTNEDVEDLEEGGVRPMGRSFAKYRDNQNTNSMFVNKWDRKYATPTTEPKKSEMRATTADLIAASGKTPTKLPPKKALSQASYKTKFKGKLKEELGKDNEWGRPELRKKFAAMTPGQEGLTADAIPTFDPRYDDVATQFSGLHPMKEETLNEISAKGAIAREKFRAKLQKRLADPKAIAKAKKTLAKKKEEEKKAPKNLVHQLHKSISVGSKVTFHDGKEHEIAPNHADKFMSKYHSLKSSIEKEALVKRAHKSHDSFMTAIHEEACDMASPMLGVEKPCTCDISGPNYPTPPMNTDVVDYNQDGREDEYDTVALENDLTSEIDSAEWEDLVDYYEDEDMEWNDDEEEDEDEDEKELGEAITPQGRLKKKFNAMRTKTRRNMARNLALKRVATPDRIKARSVRAARNMVYKRMLRGRDRSTLSSTEKQRIEAQVKRMAPMVSRLSLRLQQKERQIDRSRVANRYKKKKGKK